MYSRMNIFELEGAGLLSIEDTEVFVRFGGGDDGDHDHDHDDDDDDHDEIVLDV